MRKTQNRVGESRIMNCGSKATIIKYNGTNDIDVQFDTGEIRRNMKYGSFSRGKIDKQSFLEKANNHIGERKVMNNGLEAEIISWTNNRDISIRFEGGRIIEHTRYEYFRNGQAGSGKYGNEYKAQDRLGETRTMNCGLKATVIRYHNCTDIDVQFETGNIVKNRSYKDFSKGKIYPYKGYKKEKIPKI